MHEQTRLWNPQTILLEDMASGIQLLQELAREWRWEYGAVAKRKMSQGSTAVRHPRGFESWSV